MRLAGAFVALALVSCSAKTHTLAEGLLAYDHNRVAEAEAILRDVAGDRSVPQRDRSTAFRALARIAWLIDADEKRALEVLNRAAALDEPCKAARLRARVLDEAGQANQLVAQSAAWIAQCDDRQAKDEIRYRAADSLLAAAEKSPARDDLLVRASEIVSAITPDDSADLDVAALRLDLALAKRDPTAALKAWKDYFWLTDADGPEALTELHPADRFAEGLAPGASVREQLLLLDLLTRAGFSRQSQRFARRWNLAPRAADEPLWRKISAYLEERRKLETLLLASNRRVARGGTATDLRSAVQSMNAALVAAAGIDGDVRAGVAREYGLYGFVGKTGGFDSIHLGHLIESKRLPVDQYGRHSEVAYLVVDNMISNGYESWLWDGDAADGGWTEKGPVIVEARPEYTKAPLDSWLLVADAQRRRDYLERLPALEQDDRSALKSTVVAYLPGLAHRLKLQLAEQVLARAKRLAGNGGDLQRAFLAEYWRANLQQSIFIHEGRHALDLHIVRGGTPDRRAEREYRAKLSELALSDYPRLALFNIDGTTIGSANEHGRANRLIMARYAAWTGAHRSEVAGYDPSSPPVTQLDRLTDAQIRAIARSLDPFARTRP